MSDKLNPIAAVNPSPVDDSSSNDNKSLTSSTDVHATTLKSQEAKSKLTLLEILGLRDPKPEARPVWDGKNPSWFRSTFFQITVLGACSFLSPGLWGATAALGAGGSQDPSTVNAANSLTFGLMVLTSLFTSSLINVTSVKFALMLGTLGYAPYAAGLYLNSVNQSQWLVILGAGLCGTSAGTFWATEGAIALGYPERLKQARYISYWLMFRVLGQLLGGIINLALNYHDAEKGSISTNTYLVFVILQCLAPFCAMLLSPPHMVQRSDKTPVYLHIESSTKRELKLIWKTICKPQVLMLLPIIWQSTWSEALIGTYAANYFTVRSRALGSLLSAITASLSNYILGFFLDWKKPTINTRAKSSFIVIYTLQAAWWAWAIYIMHEYHTTVPKPTFDWTTPGYGKGFGVYIFLQIGFNVMYELNYWIIGNISDDPSELIRLASILRGVESAGQCVSYGINSTSWRLDAVASLNMAQWAVSIMPAWFVIRKIGVLDDGTKIHEARTYAEEGDRQKLKHAGLKTADYDSKGDE
ncbi:related to DUF895 domain membrane protein [Melanopsichium pennsylvanicum]|uniref:Related to DUF895 domain membrane protein n=2 Tax=Melanopsichium pennsylvanicum TaxID=63383 RepID=A0AAJ5C836_9BASI|nr:duf895 domain membrane protein [Melanopsichium pennsylvanicum 4]SNX87572.1 related to DUF895 domain membrane protein [Melanopsichium pennsylvanicum]